MAECRVTTKDHFTEAEVLRIFPDAERVVGSEVVAEDAGHIGWGFSAGLVRRDDGAMVRPDSGEIVKYEPN